MSLEVIEVETAANPTATVLWMHGLGADGQDFVPVAQELSLAAVGPVRFVFPNAPVIPVTLNGGYPMRAWYDILGAELTQRQDEQGMRRTQGAINTLIARETARGIAASRIVVAGFSQGCAMALMTGLRYPDRLAGIMGLSGYLPLLTTLAAERSPANHGLPVFLGHGRRDGMVPLAAGAATRDALTALGYPVDWHEYDMEHSVCMEEIADINRWLLRVLA
ncbi:MAG: carboxylesterase [Polaromonas sp.]|nr:carboxylesterase [Polaromonas sp.]